MSCIVQRDPETENGQEPNRLELKAEGEAEAEQMDVDQSALEQTDGQVNGIHGEPEGQGEGEEGQDDIPEEDYGALALLDTVIEEREERLSNEQVAQILAIIRETLGSGSGSGDNA